MAEELILDQDDCLEVFNIGNKTFHPLKGFMDSADYKNVVNNMHLDNGEPWTIPVTLDIPEDNVKSFIKEDKVLLKNLMGKCIAELCVEDVYKIDLEGDIKKIFGTSDGAHPGVARERARFPYRIGGAINVLVDRDEDFTEHSFSPQETRRKFQENGWKTVVGFQTRNPIHNAHEYLQKIGLEMADGIFIQPLIGWKKGDDFSPMAVVKSYEKMLECFYPKSRAMFGVLKTPMRYAGPREAVFHAIIRRNFGCTHFIVGRDHAGVGGYYDKYAAHQLTKNFSDLGIEILCLCGPYYCTRCAAIVTEKTCPHGEEFSMSVSGTEVRSLLSKGERPPATYMRQEIADVLIELRERNQLFCKDEVRNV